MALRTLVAAGFVASAAAAAPKVKLDFFHESKCPGCMDMLKTELLPMVKANGVADIIDFNDVPFGNAFYVTKECQQDYFCWVKRCSSSSPPADCFTAPEVSCQHGAQECWGNTVEACAAHAVNGTSTKLVPFAVCFEHNLRPTQEKLERCARENGIDVDVVNTCVKGSLGKQLIGESGKKTAIANKDRKEIYVPYLLLNGREVQDNVLQAVCNAYTGTKPSGCPRSRCYA